MIVTGTITIRQKNMILMDNSVKISKFLTWLWQVRSQSVKKMISMDDSIKIFKCLTWLWRVPSQSVKKAAKCHFVWLIVTGPVTILSAVFFEFKPLFSQQFHRNNPNLRLHLDPHCWKRTAWKQPPGAIETGEKLWRPPFVLSEFQIWVAGLFW